VVSSEPWFFSPPPRSDPKDRREDEGLLTEDDGLVVDEVALELDDGVCLRVADELAEEVADADEGDVVTGVVVGVSDRVVVVPFESLEGWVRALCKTSPRPRASTALSIDCSTLSCERYRQSCHCDYFCHSVAHL
jgi:hypothetical protein